MHRFHASAAHDGVVHDQLRDQLVRCLPPAARITGQGWRPWASASFAGARHWFDLAPHGTDVGALADVQLDERPWNLSGAIVADVAVHLGEPDPASWRIELLVVDD